MYLLDTNTISELRKVAMLRGDRNVALWSQGVEAEDQYLSAITLQELELGILMSERKDPAKGAVLRAWMTKQVLGHFRERILPIDAAVAMRSAQLHAQRSRSFADALIAATAYAHGFSVVTRNVASFSDTGVSVVNPWLIQ
ncbi:MAG TPA: type II toxin-antitoxin system VapC family toxin [Acidobacteriaceae bacterium]